jgi:hypothetical protein
MPVSWYPRPRLVAHAPRLPRGHACSSPGCVVRRTSWLAPVCAVAGPAGTRRGPLARSGRNPPAARPVDEVEEYLRTYTAPCPVQALVVGSQKDCVVELHVQSRNRRARGRGRGRVEPVEHRRNVREVLIARSTANPIGGQALERRPEAINFVELADRKRGHVLSW